jgi:hypothetical protein
VRTWRDQYVDQADRWGEHAGQDLVDWPLTPCSSQRPRCASNGAFVALEVAGIGGSSSRVRRPPARTAELGVPVAHATDPGTSARSPEAQTPEWHLA